MLKFNPLTAELDMTGLSTATADGLFVHLTGDESIAGNKTFTDDVTINGDLDVGGLITTDTGTRINNGLLEIYNATFNKTLQVSQSQFEARFKAVNTGFVLESVNFSDIVLDPGGGTGNGTVRMTTKAEIGGSIKLPISTKTANYTITANDHTILANATSGNITITLPTASSASGRIYMIKKIDSSVNTVTIDGNGSETIDGALTQVIPTQYMAVTIQSNGTAWFIF